MNAENIATTFSRILRASVRADEWQTIQSEAKRGRMVADDFCDANQALIDAFSCVVGREPWFASDLDEGNATEAQLDADFDTLEEAWRLARIQWAKGGIA